jgi:hypothetical protein
MQVVKVDQNRYRVTGGIAGPPYPGSYKYSALALQIEGMSTDRQTVTVKKTARKMNCGFRTVSLSGVELMWKGLM